MPQVPAHGIRFGRSPKHDAVASWVRGRPLAWLGDVYVGKDLNWAEDRRDDDKLPTLLHSIDPTRGLQRGDIDEVLAWMRTTIGVQHRLPRVILCGHREKRFMRW